MNSSPKAPQDLFLCLVGLSPAVITETLWGLATRTTNPLVPDRILTVTTASGRECIARSLFSNDQWGRFKALLAKRTGISLSGKLKFSDIPECIRVFPNRNYTAELDDIRSEDDSQAAAEFLMEVIRGLAEDEQIRLVTSIAGGRKTSGALLHSVMTLLGRESDLITHVLVTSPYDRAPEFLCPGLPAQVNHPDTGESLDTTGATIQVSEIPFVPLRCVFRREMGRAAGSYLGLMHQLRTRAINLDRELSVRLHSDEGKILVRGIPIPCSATEFAYYLHFALRAKEGLSDLATYAGLESELVELADKHKTTGDFHHWTHQVLDRASHNRLDANEDARKWASNLRKALRSANFDSIEIDRLIPRRGRLSIDLPPENIEIFQTKSHLLDLCP